MDRFAIRSVIIWLRDAAILVAVFIAVSEAGSLMQSKMAADRLLWPTAGLALAALLLGGLRLWPAIVLAGVAQSYVFLASSVETAKVPAVHAAALAHGFGAAGQAVVAFFAIRRVIGSPWRLTRDGAVLTLLLVVLPLCGLVSPTVDVVSNYWIGFLNDDSWKPALIVQWLASVGGMLLAIPLVVAWSLEPRHLRWRRLTVGALPMAIGVSLIVLIIAQADRMDRLRHQNEFSRRSREIAHDMQEEIAQTTEILYGIQSFFGASGEVDDDEFRRFAAVYAVRRPGLYTAGWAPRVTRAQRDRFEKQAAASHPGYRILEFAAGEQLIPAVDREEYLPARFVFARDGDPTQFGLDMASVNALQSQIQTAIDRGEPVATEMFPITVSQRTRPVVMLFLPLFADGRDPQTTEARRKRFRGVAGVTLDLEALLRVQSEKYLSSVNESGNPDDFPDISMSLHIEANSLVSASPRTIERGETDRPSSTSDLTEAVAFHFAGREWKMAFRVRAETIGPASWQHWAAVTGAVGAMMLLSALFLIMIGRAATIERLVADRTLLLDREVEDRRRAEQLARVSEERFRQFAEAAPQAIWMTTPDKQHVLFVNSAMERIYGVSRDKIVTGPNRWLECVHPEDRERVAIASTDDLQGRFFEEYRIVRPDGEVRHLRERAMPITNECGEVVAMAGIAEDVTEARLHESQARDQQRRFDALTKHSGVGFWQVTPDGYMLYGNDALLRMLEVDSAADLVDVETSVFFASESRGTLLAERERRKQGVASIYEATIVGRRGARHTVMISAAPLLGPDGTLHSTVGSYIDVSDLKAAEARMRANEAELSLIYHGVSDAVSLWTVDEDGELRCRRINQAAQLLFYVTETDVVGHTPEELLLPSLAGHVRIVARRAIESRETVEVFESFDFQGGRKTFEARLTPLFDALGRCTHLLVAARDVTQRLAAEEALRETEAMFSLFMRHLPGIAHMKDEHHRFIFLNEACADAFGVKLDDWLGKTLEEVLPAETARSLRANDERVYRENSAVRAIEQAKARGEMRQFLVVKFPIPRVGRAPLLGGISIDITEQLRAEEELKQAAQFRESIIQNAAEGLCVHEPIDGFPYERFSVWNDRMTEITGYTMEEINRLGWVQTLYPDPADQSRCVLRLEQMRKGESLKDESWEITRSDGQRRMLRITTTQLVDRRFPHRTLALMDDITEREHAERAMRASEARYRGVVSAMAEGLLLIDRNETIEASNLSAERLLAVDGGLVGKPIRVIYPRLRQSDGRAVDESNCAPRITLLTGVGSHNLLLQFERPDGERRWLSLNTEPIRDEHGAVSAVIATFADITEPRMAAERLQAHEQQLAHVSRVSTMGEFVAGIAHEINQPLHSIANFARACEQSLSSPAAASPELQNALEWTRHINSSVRQAANIIRRLRQFFRPSAAVRETGSLLETVRETVELLGFLIRDAQVAVAIDPSFTSALVTVDKVQVQQVLVNLIRNAIDAAKELPIERRRIEISGVASGELVEVVVRDPGPGVVDADEARLFEAFYSTKPDGMGMGLAISKTIVEAHGGRIWFTFDAQHGSEFHFTLPAATVPPNATIAPQPSSNMAD